MPRIYMRDFLTLDLRNADKRLIACDAENGGNSLLVRVAATHAAIVNGNMRFYRPDRMSAGVNTWVSGDSYPRPVLPNHDEDAAPLGRVLTAKWCDESWKYKTEYPILNDSIFYSSNSKKRMSEWESVDWIVENLCPLKDYRGLGFIELGLKITEPDAIARVTRKEYLTVSVGFSTDSAKCSVCHQDWAVDDRCEHSLGRKYDGKTCFVLSGEMDFSECSYVNSPADPFATTISVEQLTDSLNRAFFFGLSLEDQAKRTEAAGLVLTDALIGADIEMVEDKMEKIDLKQIATDLKSAELTAERALAIRKDLSEYTGDEDAKQLKKLLSTVKAKIKANGWDAAPKTELSKTVDSELAAAATPEVPAEDKDKLNAELAEAEKKVSDQTAATDTPEAEAAAQVAATNQATVSLTDSVKTIVGNEEMKDANEDVVSTVNALDAKWSGLDESGKRYLRYAVGSLMSVWYSKEDLDMYLGWLTKDSDKLIVTKKEHDELTDAIDKFDATEKQLTEARDAEEQSKLALMKQLKDALASMYVMYKVMSGAKAFQDLTTDQVKAEIAKRTDRQLASLLDSRNEIVEELQWAVPKPAAAATSTDKTNESAGLEVSDKTQVNEPTPEAGTEDATQGAGEVKVPSVKPRFMDSLVYERLQARAKFKQVAEAK